MEPDLNLTEWEKGFILGLLVGEGHFGGDGQKPQITLRMHVRHYPLLRWLMERIPGSRLYGPYLHGGRNYYQWMLRGEALKALVPFLDAQPWPDPHALARYQAMKVRYGLGGKDAP